MKSFVVVEFIQSGVVPVVETATRGQIEVTVRSTYPRYLFPDFVPVSNACDQEREFFIDNLLAQIHFGV